MPCQVRLGNCHFLEVFPRVRGATFALKAGLFLRSESRANSRDELVGQVRVGRLPRMTPFGACETRMRTGKQQSRRLAESHLVPSNRDNCGSLQIRRVRQPSFRATAWFARRPL